MGQKIRIIDSNFAIPYDYLDHAYKALCELNTKDVLKRGRALEDIYEKPQDSTSVSTNPNKWFNGLDWNYDEIYKSTEEILHALGFETEILQSGDLEIVGFEGEMGDEDAFLKALAPFIEGDGSYIMWVGEVDKYGCVWKNVFNNGKMETFHLALPGVKS